MSLLSELQRRDVFRVAAAYLVVGWLLTEVLTTILPTLGAPEWTARAVILLFALGFVPTVVLAWVFQLTPEGIKLDRDVDERAATAGRKSFNYSIIASVVLLTIIIAVLSARPVGDDSDRPSIPIADASIAVLPFVNMSNDEDNEYFSDGLTETLLHMLAQVPDLQVAARTSSFAFKGQNRDVGQIAAALRVSHILEGSVQKVGNRVRVTAQLIRASDGFHVWSSSYDRTVDDIFAIQDEIATKVGSELSQSLLGGTGVKALAAVGTENPDAYDLYLQAAKARATFSYRGLQESENLLKGALAIDPGFLDAKTELAGNYLQQYETGLMTHEQTVAEVNALVDQVLAEQPDHARAQAIYLFVDARTRARDGEPRAVGDAIEAFEELVTANPAEYQIRMLLTRLLQSVQRYERALTLQREALADDPFNARIIYEIGTLQLALRQWEQARDSLSKSLEIEPEQPNAYINLAKISLHAGDGADYMKQLLRAMAIDPRDHELPGQIAAFLYRLGLVTEGDDFRDRVIAVAPTSDIAYRLELLRALATGDESACTASARRAVEDDVSDRLFAFSGAVQHLLRVAARQNRVDEETAWLEARAPGMTDIDAETLPQKYRNSQFYALEAWHGVLQRDELMRRLDTLLTLAQSYGVDPLLRPQSRVAVMALRGEHAQATELALAEVFPQSVAGNLNWRETYAQPQYGSIVADERVQQALERWQDEWASLRSDVSAYLADLSAST